MESVAELLKWVLENLNYWVVTIFMAIESSFIPFPSEAVVPPAAWKAMADDSMNIFLVIVFATVGADIGALDNNYLDRSLGRPILYKFANSRLGHMCLIDEEKVHHAEEYFRKHGAASTFFGRLIPAVRQLISIPAGLAGMKLGPFLLYTTLGAGIWNTVLAVLGYLIYRFTDLKTTNDVYVMATKYSHEIGYVIIAVVILVVGFIAYQTECKLGNIMLVHFRKTDNFRCAFKSQRIVSNVTRQECKSLVLLFPSVLVYSRNRINHVDQEATECRISSDNSMRTS